MCVCDLGWGCVKTSTLGPTVTRLLQWGPPAEKSTGMNLKPRALRGRTLTGWLNAETSAAAPRKRYRGRGWRGGRGGGGVSVGGGVEKNELAEGMFGSQNSLYKTESHTVICSLRDKWRWWCKVWCIRTRGVTRSRSDVLLVSHRFDIKQELPQWEKKIQICVLSSWSSFASADLNHVSLV